MRVPATNDARQHDGELLALLAVLRGRKLDDEALVALPAIRARGERARGQLHTRDVGLAATVRDVDAKRLCTRLERVGGEAGGLGDAEGR